jgi:putative FmdB family regulatory protein
MPYYDFKCETCGQTVEAFMTCEQSRKGIKCPCGNMMKRAWIKAPLIKIDYANYPDRFFGDERYAEARRKKCGLPI